MSRSNDLMLGGSFGRTSRNTGIFDGSTNTDNFKKVAHNKFYKHTSILMWKSYLQRQRRWRLLALETFIGMLLFVVAIFIAKPVFLTPLQTEPEPPLATADILSSLHSSTILGYAPDSYPYNAIMSRAADILGISLIKGQSEEDLNMLLYNKSREGLAPTSIIWVIWNSQENNQWIFHIRNTERARYVTSEDETMTYTNPHLHTGFLAVQVAVSRAIVEAVALAPPKFEITLVAMPVSPLMQQSAVKKALSLILMCYTLAFLPAILETEALVVWETENMFKRALRIRSVGYSSMYLSWLVYTYLTALPVCLLGGIMLILTFRWIHLVTALLIEFAYVTVMAMVALIMAMFQTKPIIACIWTTLFTLLQTYLAELLVHHEYDTMYVGLTFLLQIILPPLGLINAFNEFALLSTEPHETSIGILSMVASWGCLILIYFAILLLLQRTIGQRRAIGGQVSWTSIIFKKMMDRQLLRKVPTPSRSDRGKVQPVSDLQARAITFRDVCKSIMGRQVLKNITFDVLRGEYTILFTEKIQEKIFETLDDLMTGLALPDSGEIRVLGENMADNPAPLNNMYMMGFCHRSDTLVDDLTVHEHFTLFSTICLWHQTHAIHDEYSQIRYHHLLNECNLTNVRSTRVRDLGVYYRAQLCWALARLLEPRVILIPSFFDEPTYRAVIVDKIMKFRNHVTIISHDHWSVQLQHADRIFVFFSNLLVFGGTPAYMFFRHGREYQLRLTLRVGNVVEPTGSDDSELLERAKRAGATVRAHLGSMLILRIQPIPTAPVAAFIKDLSDNPAKYGLCASSININVPDFEEVVRRAVKQSKAHEFKFFPSTPEDLERANNAIKRLCAPRNWKRNRSFNLHFKQIARKFIYFHRYHKWMFFITIVLAMISGLLFGLSLSTVLVQIAHESASAVGKIDKLTVESLEKGTILVVRADNTSAARSIAEAYVMSEIEATPRQVRRMKYVALPHTESFVEYLMTRAIDSPQHYVYYYAYGLDISVNEIDDTVVVQALYSALHHDHGAAARSVARVYMALIRHYTSQLDATIQVHDEPLMLDLSPWMSDLAKPPLFLQFLLILTISHITLLPSLERGMIRHTQKHASNFSPFLYWMTLYACDLMFFWLLIGIMSIVMLGIMYYTIQQPLFEYENLMVLPNVLLLYGVSCVPQAYIFSLGPRAALNLMAFVIVNMVFGETTIVAKLFYGDALSYVLDFMSLSPQFNMAYAYVKIKQIFLYNVECLIFQTHNLCSTNKFHKCCENCGILQECFSRRSYLSRNPGIIMEMLAMLMSATFFTGLLLLIEYKIFHLVYMYCSKKIHTKDAPQEVLMKGTTKMKNEVIAKQNAIMNKEPKVMTNTFGEYLCVSNLSARDGTQYTVRNVYLGLGKGEALAISGLKRHGRLRLCQMLAGYTLMTSGRSWVMSKWSLETNPHKYSKHISICCELGTLPPWMNVRDALFLIGCLRGLPIKVAQQNTIDLIESLELSHLSHKIISELRLGDRTRLRFAAAVIGAPRVIILDEVTAGQKHSVRRAMYSIVYLLRKRGHAILTAASNIESHMPVTNHLALMIDGVIHDVDTIDNLIERYTRSGFTVVVHLKSKDVDVEDLLSNYFINFEINDSSGELVNVQLYDLNLNCNIIFQKMEALVKASRHEVCSYIVTVMTIDFIFNSLIVDERGPMPVTGFLSWKWAKKLLSSRPKTEPTKAMMSELRPFKKKFDITSLIGLPWSVIFHKDGEYQTPSSSEESLDTSSRV